MSGHSLRQFDRLDSQFKVLVASDQESFETVGLNISPDGIFMADPKNRLRENIFEINLFVYNRQNPARFMVEKLHQSTYQGVDGWGLKFLQPC